MFTKNLHRILISCLAFLFLLVLSFGISKSLSFSSNDHIIYQTTILKLQSKEAQLNQEILQARYELFPSYDLLVEYLLLQQSLEAQLQKIPNFIQGKDKQQILSFLNLHRELLERKETLLEQFKSKNATFKNSLRYLPLLVSEAQNLSDFKPQLNVVLPTLNQLLYDILLYNLTPDQSLELKISSQLKELSQIQQKYEIKESEFPISLLNAHAQIILTYKSKVDQLTNKILNIPLLATSQSIEEFYINAEQKALKSINFYRLITYIWVLFGVSIVAILVIKSLIQSNQKIEILNKRITNLNNKLKIENVRMSSELHLLKQMQQMILPKPEELQAIDCLDIAGYMEPAEEVGGDYYDVLQTDGVVTIGIGDVTGHGLESGILMLMTQTAVRTLKEIKETNFVEFLATLNRTIYKNIQRMKTDKNLTLAIVNYFEGKLMISGQHEEVLVIRGNGHLERIDTIDLGFPIGLDGEISEFINQISIELNSGEGLVLYTDGITEACNIHNQQYGIERLCKAIQTSWFNSADGIKQAVIADVQRFIGEQKLFDDITLLVLKKK